MGRVCPNTLTLFCPDALAEFMFWYRLKQIRFQALIRARRERFQTRTLS